MGGYYPPRRSRTSRGSHERMLELILRQGDISAQSRLQGADILSSLVGNLGQQGAAAIEAVGKEKALKKQAAEMGKRDAAWVQYVESGEWQKSPDQAYVTARRIFGPDGDKQFMALQGVAQLMGEKRNPEADQKSAGAIIGAMDALGDGGRRRLYPQARGIIGRIYPDAQVGDQYIPEEWPTISAIGQSLRGEKAAEPFTLGPGQQRFGPDGQPLAAVPEAPPKPPNLQTVETAEGIRTFNPQTGEMGPVIGRGKPPAGREPPRPVQIETTDENGKPVTRFVNPEAGASYPKPTGAGKPATGQQRKALQFFNRGKEAQEIASTLEEGGKVNPTRLKYTPGFANVTLSNEDQSYQNAQRAFTEARLRKESGAAVPQYEYENDAKTYFAQPGDSPETVAQKRAGRNAILAGIAFESGDALREFYGDEAEGMVEGYKAQSKSGPRRIKDDSEFDALASGTLFIAPDGTLRRKP